MHRWLRAPLFACLGIALLACAYVGTAALLMFWPVAASSDGAPANIEAYVSSNGVHTDFLLPIHTDAIDWATVFSPDQVDAMPADAAFIAIGWGDRAFYLNTPTWADLTASRAFGALLGGHPAALHVTWLSRAQVQQGAYALPLSHAQYRRLVAYVRQMLPAAQATQIAGARYNRQDAFYEARGSYNAFETCNTWTGRGLREAGVAASRWTPFDWNVVWHLEPARP